MQKKEKVLLLVIAATILFLITATILQMQPRVDTALPRTLGDMDLKLYIEGEEAKKEISTLHSSGVRPEEGYIGRYRNYDTDPENAADVWLSVSDSPKNATGLVERMTERMAGSMMFSSPQVKDIDGHTIYYTVGTGQYHYYYAKGNNVVWIGLSNPDISYQEYIISQALKEIGK